MTKKKDIKSKPRGPGSDDKNPFLNVKGGLDLDEEFPGIDYMLYERKRLKKAKKITRIIKKI